MNRCIVAILVFTAVFIGFKCNLSPEEGQITDNSSFIEGQKVVRELPNLVPVGIDNWIIYDKGWEIDTFYTGWQIVDINRYTATIYCVVKNVGNATFTADNTKNNHFIHLKWAQLDTVTGELFNCQEYWKNDFQPIGTCLPDSQCTAVSGAMAVNTYDMYIEELDSIDIGHIILMAEYNADNPRGYDELSYNDNTLFLGFDWRQNPVCPYPIDHPLACFNGYVSNRFLTQKVKNQLRTMK